MAIIDNAAGKISAPQLSIGSRSLETRLGAPQQKALADKLDVARIKEGIAEKPAFVLEQFPPAGEEVPAGTTIDLVMLPKDNVRVDDVVVDQRVKQAFPEQDVTSVRKDIEQDARVKEVFERDIGYDALNAEDKKVFDQYVREKGIVTGDPTPEDLKSLHDDSEALYKF